MEESTQFLPWVRYVVAGTGAVIAGSLAVVIGSIVRSNLREPGKVSQAIAEVKQKQKELKNLYGSDIGDLLYKAEKLHAASHAFPYVRHNNQILDQEKADYNVLVAIARQLKIPETDPRVIKAQELYESANGKNYVRPPQLLEQADANYELSLAILEHLKTVKNHPS